MSWHSNKNENYNVKIILRPKPALAPPLHSSWVPPLISLGSLPHSLTVVMATVTASWSWMRPQEWVVLLHLLLCHPTSTTQNIPLQVNKPSPCETATQGLYKGESLMLLRGFSPGCFWQIGWVASWFFFLSVYLSFLFLFWWVCEWPLAYRK